MKITFVATFMTHHQLPFSLKMVELTDNNYTYIAGNKLDRSVVSAGYQDLDHYPFIIRAYESDTALNAALERIEKDDMVIFGSCPDEWVEMRSRTGKPFIIYSERFFKKGTYRRFIPITRKKIEKRLLQFKEDNVSIICSSAYLPYDIKLLNSEFQIYKWGYFPATKSYSIADLKKIKKHTCPYILWVGRLIQLKHPQHAVIAAKVLRDNGYVFKMDFVGDGPLRTKLEKLVTRYGLTDCIHFQGSKKTDEVRSYMERANIFLFTSDKHEGWGAVLNESMNSGCAVIASHAAGAVPFLINDGENGLVYESGNVKHLIACMKRVLDNPQYCETLGLKAYDTITKFWNPDVATERLYKTIEAKINNTEDELYKDGPCSIASVITDRFQKKEKIK